MEIEFYKYQGTGNDFIMIDNRTYSFPKNNVLLIQKMCDRRFGIGADGLILLEPSKENDFNMVYYNADGNEGSMCGNGGRCIVAFSKKLGIIKEKATFEAVDGLHFGYINNDIVSLQMIDVEKVEVFKNHSFLNTGSPHHIQFTDNISNINVKELGSKIRYGSPYFKEGTNVNFAQQISDSLFKVRTYERGVENETLACGTGVTAVAIAANKTNKTNSESITLEVLGGTLEVSFKKNDDSYTTIFLKGEAQYVYEGKIKI